MKMKCLLPVLGLLTASASLAQTPPPAGAYNPASRMAAQREAMRALAFLDGHWRGTAEAHGSAPLLQTERVGTLLDGTIRVVEGRGYDSSGRTVFNALGVISYDPVRRTYSMHANANGFGGNFPLEVRADGFSWSQPAGPGASIRYTATVRDGEWHEVGERIAEGAAPTRMIEMRLRRIGDSDWPAEGVVPRR
jgi:hypothetical protein